MHQQENEVLILEAESRAALVETGRRLRQALPALSASALKDLAYTVNHGLASQPYRLALVASSLDDLQDKLDKALASLEEPKRTQIKARQGIYFFEQPLGRQGKLALLFPGEGSQYSRMLEDLCLYFPEVRVWFDRLDRIFLASGKSGTLPSQFIFPLDDEQAGDTQRLWQMDAAVGVVTTANLALLSLLRRLEIQPDAIVGHSTGEYAALQASGIMAVPDEEAYLRLMSDLDHIFQGVEGEEGIPQAALVAVGADRATVERVIEGLGGGLVVAMDNCPHQTVVAGPQSVADQFIQVAQQKGLIYESLSFDRPYHTPQFEPFAAHLRSFFTRWLSAAPSVPTYSCTTSAPFPADVEQIREIAYQHWIQPVEFRRTVQAMHADGIRIFLEVGPRGNLTAFVDDTLRAEPHLALAMNVPSRSGISQLNHTVALLAAHAVPMALDFLYERRAPRLLSLDPAQVAPVSRAVTLQQAIPLLHIHPDKVPVRAPQGLTPLPPQPVPAPVQPASPPTPVAASVRPEITQASRPAAETSPLKATPQEEVPLFNRPTDEHDPTAGTRGRVMQSYFHTMEHFLTVQQTIMQAYLAGSGAAPITVERAHARPAAPRPEALPAPQSVPQVPPQPQPVAFSPPPPLAPAAAPPAPPVAPAPVVAAAPAPAAVQTNGKHEAAPAPQPRAVVAASAPRATPNVGPLLLRLVSEKTGYPTEMLDLTLDLEADLGIDSIKRVEILGAFQQETGINLSSEMESLAARKTLQEMIAFLEDGGRTTQEAAPPSPAAAPAAAVAAPAPVAAPSLPAVGPLLLRLVSEKTGYPTEMLDLTLDLEADLGIDSIKRVEILGAFQQETGINLSSEMESLAARKTLQEMIAFLESNGSGAEALSTPNFPFAPSAQPTEARPAFPLIGEVVALTPGESLMARSTLSLDRLPFLRDHTLGRDVSVLDPTLTGLPIMPLTMSMELMAEAAALLEPGLPLVGMREVRTYRWIPIDQEAVVVQVSARRVAPGEVHVQVRDAASGEQGMPILEGTMRFAERYAPPPQAAPLRLGQASPSALGPEALYRDAMFHGPMFRGVRSLDRLGSDGAEATLETLPMGSLFAQGDPAALQTDPVLLDQPGQVVGFWTVQLLEEGYLIFPYRLESLDLYGPLLPVGERVTCQARIALMGEQGVRSDLDVVRADGRVWIRFTGWEDRRFDFPRAFFDFQLAPRDRMLSEPWPEGGAHALRFRLDSFPDGFFGAHGGIWLRVLAHLLLSRAERAAWHAQEAPMPERLAWLLGRAVAKDAARVYVREQFGVTLCPADIEIALEGGIAQVTDLPYAVPPLTIVQQGGMLGVLVGAAPSPMGQSNGRASHLNL